MKRAIVALSLVSTAFALPADPAATATQEEGHGRLIATGPPVG